MQTFLVKLVCLFLFGFIFYSAYLSNNGHSSTSAEWFSTDRSVLVANKIETKTFTVEMQQPTKLLDLQLSKISL